MLIPRLLSMDDGEAVLAILTLIDLPLADQLTVTSVLPKRRGRPSTGVSTASARFHHGDLNDT